LTILLVNNYLRRPDAKIKRYVRALRALTDEHVEVVRFQDLGPDAELSEDVRAVVLSGSEACLSKHEERPLFMGLLGFLRKLRLPTLGICFGHQLIGLAFGAEVVAMREFVKQPKEVVVEVPDDIFASWLPGDRILVAESHGDEVASLPAGFVRLATSDFCRIEAMKHLNRPMYGVQFHPERRPEGWPSGEEWPGLEVLRNFLSSAGLARSWPKRL